MTTSPTKFKSATPATVYVYIENTGQLTYYDLEQGASHTLLHLRNLVAKSLGVAPSSVTCKLYKNVMDLNMRLCQIPDGVVVQVHTNDEKYESGLFTDSAVTTPLSTGRRSGNNGSALLLNQQNQTFASQSQVTSIYNSANAPTNVKKGEEAKWRQHSLNEKFTRTQTPVNFK